MNERTCPLCGSTNTTHYEEELLNTDILDNQGFGVPFKCLDCGQEWVNDYAVALISRLVYDEELDEFYEHDVLEGFTKWSKEIN